MRNRIDHVIVQVALLVGVMLIWLSIARYAGYNAGMRDLGNMAQSIWTATQGLPLLHTAAWMGPRSRLNVHVEFIYYAFVPFYKLWSDPRLLLTIQAALFVAGAIPVYRIAMRRTQSVFAARCLATIYLFYPTAQTSVLFDFHGDTLAMPLLLFALDALDARQWLRYGLWTALALSCKFYVALPVAGIGAVFFLWGRRNNTTTQIQDRRAGLLTALLAICYGAVAFLVIRPLFATPGLAGMEKTSGWYLTHYFGELAEIWATLGDRLLSAMVVFGPVFLIIGRGWRWLLPGLPVAFAMLLTTGPGGAHDFRYHHYALVVPFILMACIDGVNRAQEGSEVGGQESGIEGEQSTVGGERSKPRRRSGRNWRSDVMITLISVFIFNTLLVDTPLNPFFWIGMPGEGLDPSVYGITPRDTIKDNFLQDVDLPPDAPLATSTLLAPHQINRETLYLVRYPEDPGAELLPMFLPLVDYVMADALFDYYIPIDETSYGGGVAYEREAIGLVMQDAAFQLVAARDGLLFFKRGASSQEVLEQDIEVLENVTSTPLTLFGDEISLLNATFTPRDGQRLQATFDWFPVGAGPAQNYVAVSELVGIEGNRIVHLPTYTLYPTSQWQPGQIIRERFDIDTSSIPAGTYNWRVGWYVLEHPYSYRTDERSILPGSSAMVVSKVTIK